MVGRGPTSPAAALPDSDWIDPLVSFYRWSSGVDGYVEQRRSEAQIALVCSESAIPGDMSDQSDSRPSAREAFNGWYLTLLGARVPFDVVPEHRVADTDLDQYDSVIVPSGSGLADRTARALTAFVRSGGALVAGCGTVRPTQELLGHRALAAVTFGTVSFDPPAAARPQASLRLSDGPRAIAKRGRSVQLRTDLDATLGRSPADDGRQLLEACARASLPRDGPSISTAGGGLVRVHAWRNPVGLSVYLVNRTTAGSAGEPALRLVDAGPQAVRIKLERLRDVRRVRLMRRGGLARWTTHDELMIEVEVPSLVDFEMITVDLAS